MTAIDEAERTLRSERLVLEPVVAAHAPELFELFAEPGLYRFLPQDPPAHVDVLRERFTKLQTRQSPDGEERWLNWVCRDRASAAVVAFVEVSLLADGEAQMAYFASRPHWRQGYATEACTRVLDHMHAGFGARRVSAEIDTRNEASLALVRGLGLRCVGEHRGADFFKGESSDEYVFAAALPLGRADGPPEV